MNTHKALALSLLLSAGALSTQTHAGILKNMIEEIDQMHAAFDAIDERMTASMNKMYQSMHEEPQKNVAVQPTLSIEEQHNGIQVLLKHLVLDTITFDADINQDDNTLTVNTLHGILKLQARRNLVTIEYQHQENSGKEPEHSHGQRSYTIYRQIAHHVSGELKLGDTDIEYDPTQHELRITIPYKKKTVTKVPVKVKEAPMVTQEK